MSNTLKYGFDAIDDEPRLFLDVPIEVIERSKNYRQSHGIGRKALDCGLVSIEQMYRTARLTVNPPHSYSNGTLPVVPVHDALRLFDTVASDANGQQEDPDLKLFIGGEQDRYSGQYGMLATIHWPSVAENDLAQLATARMQMAARQFSFLGPSLDKLVDKAVYAVVSREHGVALHASPAGSSNLISPDLSSNSSAAVFDLSANEIYSADQQLLCLYGVVAIASQNKSD